MQRSILVVDDDPSFHPLVSACLKQNEWQVTCVKSGAEAVEHLSKVETHLVVADLEMPGMSGQELTVKIAADYREVPVVVMAGKGGEQAAIESFRAGAADYVKKADVKASLAALVAKLLNEELVPSQEQEAETVSTPSEEERPKHGEELQRDYVVIKSKGVVRGQDSEEAPEMTMTHEKLRVLRRQAERLEKRNKLGSMVPPNRKHDRRDFLDVVFIIPLSADGLPILAKRSISFCRNISAGGCSLLHSRLIRQKEFVIFFPHLGDKQSSATAIQAEIVRDRPLSLGVYEIGVKFQKIVKLSDEEMRMLAACAKAD